MAALHNDSGGLRLALRLVQREGARAGEAPGRVLAVAGLEVHDARDGEWWPLVRLPSLWFPPGAVEALADLVRDLLQGASPGFAWRPGEDAALAVQLGAAEGGAVVEVGLDLGPLLASTAGLPPRADAELALFRFRAAQDALVRFADALAADVEALSA